MSVIAVTSSRTSPGATTLAAGLAIAWSHLCERSLLIEADPSGGVLSLRFDLASAPTLSTFGSDIRNGYLPELVWLNTQDMRGVRCMPAPVDPRLARSWTERVSPALIENLSGLGAPTVIDLGWVGEDGHSLALAQAADTTLIVTTPHTAEVQALLFQIRQLKSTGANVALVVVGDRPNDPQEIAELAGVPLAAVLPDDRGIAAALGGAKFAPNKFRRSLLWRTMSGLAVSLLDEELMVARSASATPEVATESGLTSERAALAFETDVSEASSPGTGGPEQVLVGTTSNVVASFDGTESSVVARTPVVLAKVPPTADLPLPIPPASIPPAPIPPMPVYDPAAVAPTPIPPRPTYQPELLPPEPTVQMLRELVLSNGQRHTLVAGNPITIGRHSTCDVVILDSQISRHHGTLNFTGQGWTYVDNGSRNGSLVNGRRCVESVLTIEDELVIGQTRLSFKSLAMSGCF